ncbi:MAG: transporter substrate binding protein [Pseudobdellovibrio sp.]|nr:transporter substrate binding protein [Pseudobdellovibrio sp.]
MTQLKVGAFIISGIAVLFTTIFMLGSNKSYFSNVIEVHGYFDSVQGLNKGAVVSLAGVKVGNLDETNFDETKNLVKVTLTIEEDFKTKIKKDSHMEIRTQGALGDKYIYITPGVGTETVKHGDELQTDYGNDILSVLSKRGNESEKLFDILNDIKKITAALAQDNHLPNITANMDKTSANMARVSEQLNKTMQSGSLDRSVTKLEKIIDKVDKGEGTLGALINDRSLHDRFSRRINSKTAVED